MKTIQIKNNKFALHFPYDKELVDAVKDIPGRRYWPTEHAWTVPIHTKKVIDLIDDYDFFVIGEDARSKIIDIRGDITAHIMARHRRDNNLDSTIPVTTGSPWKHQRQAYGFAHLIPSTLLDMWMGTGKSKVVIDLINNNDYKSILIACPLSVIPAWQDQVNKHAAIPMSISLLNKRSVAKKRDQAINDIALAQAKGIPRLTVVNYEALWREPFAAWALGHHWDMVVLDEAHKIKSPGGKASRYAAKLGARVDKRLALSGTPLPHSPLDAYGLFRFLDPDIYGTSFAQFRAKYAVMGGFDNRQVLGFQNKAEFSEKFNSITFRASKDAIDLPDFQHITLPVQINSKARAVYDSLSSRFMAELDEGTITTTNALTKLLRMQQVTSGTIKDDDGKVIVLHDDKANALGDLLDGLPEHEPVVVFARFHADLDAVHAAAKHLKRSSSELSGRRKELEQWQSGDTDIIACQIGAGAEGIDLTRARYCIYYSIGFSLGQYEQSLSRTHRPGQTRKVFYYHLVVQNSVDEKVYQALADRKDVIESIIISGVYHG